MFDLPRLSLVYLVRNRGRVVSKDDLIQGVWGGRIVWDSALTTRLNAASQGAQRQWRSAVCHSYRAPQGVRFIGEVSEDPEPAVPIEAARAAIEPPTTPRLSIVVPPFANMSGDPDQEFFADRIVEEIITALSRIRWLFVMARYWSFTYKGQAIDVKQLGRDLGVRDVLEGSVRKAGGRMRITAQLIDAQSGAHLQADASTARWRTSSSCRIKWHQADVIEPALRAAETARSANLPTDDLTVYNLYLRAYATVLSLARQIPEALRLAEQASRDPRYRPALADVWARLTLRHAAGTACFNGQSVRIIALLPRLA